MGKELHQFLLDLANEEYANGSDEVAIEIKRILKGERGGDGETISIEEMANEVFNIYFKDRLDGIERAEKRIKLKVKRKQKDGTLEEYINS